MEELNLIQLYILDFENKIYVCEYLFYKIDIFEVFIKRVIGLLKILCFCYYLRME